MRTLKIVPVITLQNIDVDINELCRRRLYEGCTEFLLFSGI